MMRANKLREKPGFSEYQKIQVDAKKRSSDFAK